MSPALSSQPGVVQVQVLRGAACPPDAQPRLLVEVPHGADEPAHYFGLARQLRGPLPADLDEFFYVNTDVGAWALGVAAARQVLAARPSEAALLLRCLVPRTFIDCNRELGGDRATPEGKATVTAGLPAYVRDPDDHRLLRGLHARYVAATDRAYAALAEADGLALVPHTYAPRTVGIDAVGDDIVQQLRSVWAPGVAETWPLRAEVDLITQDADGARWCPPGAVEALTAGFAEVGVAAEECGTYWLHPATRAATLSLRHPRRLLCLEVRRDLLTEAWTPLRPLRVNHAAAERLARPLSAWLAEAL